MVRRKGSEILAIYCWFIQVVIILSLTAMVIWLSTRPRSPKFTISNVYAQQISNQNVSKVQENKSNIRINSLGFVVDITNPNYGMTICYVDIMMSLNNGGLLIGNKSLGTFCQDHKKTVKEEVLIGIDHKKTVKEEVLRVTIETMIKYHILKWKTKIHHIGFEGFVRIGTNGNVTENGYLQKTHA